MRSRDQGRKLRTVVTVGLTAVRSGAGVVSAEKDGSGWGVQLLKRIVREVLSLWNPGGEEKHFGGCLSPLPSPLSPLGVCGAWPW